MPQFYGNTQPEDTNYEPNSALFAEVQPPSTEELLRGLRQWRASQNLSKLTKLMIVSDRY